MTKTAVYSIKGEKIADVELPKQFSETIRPDLIKRAVLAIQSHNYQKYGADPEAGNKQGKAWTKNRHRISTTYNIGISRISRKAVSIRGKNIMRIGARAAQTIGGRTAHNPDVNKVISHKLNVKEKFKALRSAIAASINKNLVEQKHTLNGIKTFPLIVENKIENLKKSKEVVDALENLGLTNELERTKQKKIRAGKGTMRGRKYKRKVGPLIVVSGPCDTEKSARNIPGVEVCQVKYINSELLAPGARPSRLVIWTPASLDVMNKEDLFK
ncbi:MAG: 50S ribosomal protein L4 [DPANN group archaeon]|nr:50S ribosomal protein L4P [uncultured archaeon]MBS3063826.1 50S ribosomal protein L4 [DPANN group archaeon]